MDWNVGIVLCVQEIVVQPVSHTVCSHRDSSGSTAGNTDGIVGAFVAKEAPVCSIVRQDEESLTKCQRGELGYAH
jgi:hypothetical protein